MATDRTLLGAAGEHYVMYRLLRRGFIGALAPDRVPAVDIVVSDRSARPIATIQVKTTTKATRFGGWFLSKKNEEFTDKGLFYFMIEATADEHGQPKLYIIPSKVVAVAAKSSHDAWLKGKEGRKDSNMRRLIPDYSRIFGDTENPYSFGWMDQYLEAWHLLAPTNSSNK